MTKAHRLLFAALALGLIISGWVSAAEKEKAGEHAVIHKSEELSWSKAPEVLPEGAEVAVLEGDPSEEGLFTMRIRLPDGYRVPPHKHPGVERLTILSGTFGVGMGETFDEEAIVPYQAGDFIALHPGAPHFV
jgi:quercetin dioxygenase-like cupin family protein